MDKRSFKKIVCLFTIWVFLLNQFAYASLYDGLFGLPSSETMPVGYQQIDSTLSPSDGEEGSPPEPPGIWDWLVRNIGPVLETAAKIIFAPFLFLTACSPQLQPQAQVPATPTATPTPTPLPPTPTPEPPTPTPIPPTPTLSPELQRQIEGWIADSGSRDVKVMMSATSNLIQADIEAVDLMLNALADKSTSIRSKNGIVVVIDERKKWGYLEDEARSKAAVEAMIPLLWAESEEFPLVAYEARLHVYTTLRRIGGPQAEAAINKARADDNWLFNPGLNYLKGSTRAERTLAGLILSVTDSRAVDPLLVALDKETELTAKRNQIYALGELGDSRAIPTLERIAASDKDESLRKKAEEALKKIRQK